MEILLVAVAIAIIVGLPFAVGRTHEQPRRSACEDCGGRAQVYCLGADLCGSCAVTRDRKAFP